jgi:hypothetical protein
VPTGDWFPIVHPVGCRCAGCNAAPLLPFYQPTAQFPVCIDIGARGNGMTLAPARRFLSRIRVRRRRA